MRCSHPTSPKTELAAVTVTGIQLTLLDPELGLRGAKISFRPTDSVGITSFHLYRSLQADSLGAAVKVDIDAQSRSVVIPLPDSSPPMTVYFGLKAIQRLETGETWQSGEMHLDSVMVLSPAQIYAPGKGDTLDGAALPIEVGATTDQGMVMRQMWWEKEAETWSFRLDTCLPRNDCFTPRFGTVSLSDTVVLNFSSSTPRPALVCVLGSEVFDGRLSAQRQSLSCSRFYRKSR
jgi:hypothetical protein